MKKILFGTVVTAALFVTPLAFAAQSATQAPKCEPLSSYSLGNIYNDGYNWIANYKGGPGIMNTGVIYSDAKSKSVAIEDANYVQQNSIARGYAKKVTNVDGSYWWDCESGIGNYTWSITKGKSILLLLTASQNYNAQGEPIENSQTTVKQKVMLLHRQLSK